MTNTNNNTQQGKEVFLCQCGCGQPVNVTKYAIPKYVYGHHLKGNKHGVGNRSSHYHIKYKDLPRICKSCGRDTPPHILFIYKTQLCTTCANKEWRKQWTAKLPKHYCKCGCGTVIPTLSQRKRPKEYVHGHKTKSPSTTRQYNSRYKKKNHVFAQGNNRFGRMPGVSGMPGIMVNKNDYVLVRVKDHPRASKLGYVPASVLMMEDHLGRYLYPWEYVERLNGLSRDNRIQNLRLRIRHTTIVRTRLNFAGIKDPDSQEFKLRCKVSYLQDHNMLEAQGKDTCNEMFYGNNAILQHIRQAHKLFLEEVPPSSSSSSTTTTTTTTKT